MNTVVMLLEPDVVLMLSVAKGLAELLIAERVVLLSAADWMLDFVPGWVWGKDVEIFPVAAVPTEDVVPVVLDGIGKGAPRSE